MSDADEALSRYLDQQPSMREQLLHDPVQHAQVEALRQILTMTERALADEGIPEDVRRRVVNRIVWGEPEGLVDVRAAERERMVAAAKVTMPMSWESLYPGRVPEDGPPSTKECEAAARAVLERGYVATTVYGDESAGPARLDEEPT